ncbi:hypothetical protein R3P38DRAFT_2850336 [Favolaschia claudopus]|uniref:Uncharacterized protein n=1 Tax=Favolaschia claudopus TaxID=2862362 RepID=A0AAW0DXR3_9AGAR
MDHDPCAASRFFSASTTTSRASSRRRSDRCSVTWPSRRASRSSWRKRITYRSASDAAIADTTNTFCQTTRVISSISSNHRLFISAFTIAPKVIYDDTYSNKS